MGNPSLSFNLMFIFSLSLVPFTLTQSSSSSSSPFPLRRRPFASSTASSPPKASASDLLSILGPKDQSSKINRQEAKDLKSCLKFLVPFTPTPHQTFSIGRKRKIDGGRSLRGENCETKNRTSVEDELVWWPPAPVLELARLAMDSGGDPSAIHRTLDPTVLPVPDIEGSKEERCQLTRTPYGRRFISEELNSYMAFLFELIAARGPTVGLHVSLSRFDFFHGHLFIANDSSRLGILFHAKEYPACEKDVFPYNMGYCQKGSNVAYDDSMNLRNILWLAPLPSNTTKAWASPGVLVVLDAHPGGIIYEDLIPEYVNYVRTIYEDDFGDVVVDVNYLNVRCNKFPPATSYYRSSNRLFLVRSSAAGSAMDNLFLDDHRGKVRCLLDVEHHPTMFSLYKSNLYHKTYCETCQICQGNKTIADTAAVERLEKKQVVPLKDGDEKTEHSSFIFAHMLNPNPSRMKGQEQVMGQKKKGLKKEMKDFEKARFSLASFDGKIKGVNERYAVVEGKNYNSISALSGIV